MEGELAPILVPACTWVYEDCSVPIFLFLLVGFTEKHNECASVSRGGSFLRIRLHGGFKAQQEIFKC